MIYPLIVRPLLFQLDAETAHDITLNILARLSRFRWLTEPLRSWTHARNDAVTLAGIRFPNRVGLAGGLDKNAVAVRAWWALGFGFVEVGTVTPRPQAGNPKPRMLRRTAQHAILNRMGFNNDGADAVASRLSLTVRPAFPIGVSIGKQATTPVNDLAAVAEDYAECAAKLGPHADFLSVNVSSPNTAGLRSLQSAESLRTILTAANTAKPLFVKFAPELAGRDLQAAADAALSSGATGLIATNTLASQFPNGAPCGLSGRPLKAIALRRVEELRRFVGDQVPLIGLGGIDDSASARAMLAAGADLIQLYTGLVYQGPFLAARLCRQIGNSRQKQAPVPPDAGR